MKKKLFLIAFSASSFLPSFGEVGYAYGYSFDFRFREDGTAEILSCSPKPYGDFMVPASLSYQIGENVWKNVSITSIYGAFGYCPDLTSVGFPVSIERIDCESFVWCTGLKSVDLPDNVKYVGVSAFGGCPITNLAIRGNCYVHGDAFPSCELESVSFSDDVVFSWGNYFNVSNQSLIDFISVPGITLLDGYAIPCLTNNVTIEWQLPKVLDLSAARGLAGFALTSYSIDWNTGSPGEVETIILSDSIKNIPPEAFDGLPELKSVVFSTNSSLKRIYQMAFADCPNLEELELPAGVELVDYYAFWGSGLKRIVFPASLKRLSFGAFQYAANIVSVQFMGDAPELVYDNGDWRSDVSPDYSDRTKFNNGGVGFTVAVPRGSLGWNTPIPGLWYGAKIEYILATALAELPLSASAMEVTDTIEMVGFADKSALKSIIAGNVTNYNALCEWSQSVCDTNGVAAGVEAVKGCCYTSLSYALGADRLIAKEITSNDVHIVKLAMSPTTGGGAMGSSRPTFAFEVAIDGVNIGGGAVETETLKANLKKVLGIEGATTLSPDTFSSDNIEITFDAPVDGKARFTVTSPADADNSFFMRVKVK